IVAFWTDVFDRVYGGVLDSWGYIWTFTVWAGNGVSLISSRNLVSNIGFGNTATHTTNPSSALAGVELQPARFPLVHPRNLVVDASFEKARLRRVFGLDTRPQLIRTVTNYASILGLYLRTKPAQLPRKVLQRI